MTDARKLIRAEEVHKFILFFATKGDPRSYGNVKRVCKLWNVLTSEVQYEAPLRELLRGRIRLREAQTLAWDVNFAKCFLQGKLANRLESIHDLMHPTSRSVADGIGYGRPNARKPEYYQSMITPVIDNLKALGITFRDSTEELELFFVIEAEAYLRKYGNSLKNMDKLLIYYSGMGGLEAVKFLVLKGANPNKVFCHYTQNSSTAKEKLTPLQMATWIGWLPIMKYLVEECRVDINWRNSRGETVLSEALVDTVGIDDPKVEEERIQYLLAHGLNPTFEDLNNIAEGMEIQEFFTLLGNILTAYTRRQSELINRCLKKYILSESEALNFYKNLFDTFLVIPSNNIISKEKLNKAWEKIISQKEAIQAASNAVNLFIVQSARSSVDAINEAIVKELELGKTPEEFRSSLIKYYYKPIIGAFQSAEENALLKVEQNPALKESIAAFQLPEEAEWKKSVKDIENKLEEHQSKKPKW